MSNTHYANLLTSQAVNNGTDITVSINTDSTLFSVRDSTNRVLFENVDYVVNNNNVIIQSPYINAVKSRNTTLYFEFNNEVNATFLI